MERRSDGSEGISYLSFIKLMISVTSSMMMSGCIQGIMWLLCSATRRTAPSIDAAICS